MKDCISANSMEFRPVRINSIGYQHI